MRTTLLAVAVAATVAVPVLVLDPMGLFEDFTGPSWKYGEAEMRAAVEGTWDLTTVENGVTKSWRLEIRQSAHAERRRSGGLVRSAAACGSRSFVRSASACAEASFMPLEITVKDDPANPHAFGLLTVGDTVFERGHLEITIGKDYNHVIAGTWAIVGPSGNVLEMSPDAKLARVR